VRFNPAFKRAQIGVVLPRLAAIYFLERSIRGTPIARVIEWVLFPGVALWFGAGGTIFNGGIGETGDFLVIVAGSAGVWAIVILVAMRTFTWLRRRSLIAR